VSRTAALLVSPLCLLVACTDDTAPPVPEGPHYQYVVSELYVPQTNTEARQFGLDINGDKTVDNQLGMVFSTLDSMGLGVGDTAHEALVRGGLIMLADLQTPAFDDTEASGLTTFLGRDPVPGACLDPTQLDTCGQHLTGSGSFTAIDGSASSLAIAPITNGSFTATMRRLPVKIALVSAVETIDVVLHAARVRVTNVSPTGGTAIIAGGITKADIDNDVIPQAAAQIDRIVTNECGKPNGQSPCGCVQGTRARLLQNIFDQNRDCSVDTHEVAENTITVSLLAPDVTVNGEPLLSFGIAVDLVSATFPPLPAP